MNKDCREKKSKDTIDKRKQKEKVEVKVNNSNDIISSRHRYKFSTETKKKEKKRNQYCLFVHVTNQTTIQRKKGTIFPVYS